MDRWDVVVVGAGIAGVTAVRTLVKQQQGISVLLVNGESSVPYKRTKLSKYIANGFAVADYFLEPESWYRDGGVTLLSGVEVTAINRASHEVALSDGRTVGYGKLILAHGAEPVFPPAVRPHEAGSFFVLRALADLDRLVKAVKQAKRVMIGGMGVLAVEVAYQLTLMGKQVTLAGAAAQLMPKQLNSRSSEILENLLASNGVRLRFQEEVLSFEPRRKGGITVSMIRDSAVFDMVIFCIGVAPRLELARSAGLETARGITVNEFLQTSDPDIYAAGDIAEHHGGIITQLWHAAEYQGEVAAVNASGSRRAFDNPPFRLKCEVFGGYFFSAGMPANPLDFRIDEREIGECYQCFYYDGESRLAGAIMVNDKERAPTYQEAVMQHWERERVHVDLSLS